MTKKVDLIQERSDAVLSINNILNAGTFSKMDRLIELKHVQHFLSEVMSAIEDRRPHD